MPLENTVALILEGASLMTGGLTGVGTVMVVVSPPMP